MTQQQAETKLEEIRRLLMERERIAKAVSDIDAQIASLAGAAIQARAPKQQRLGKHDFMAIAGVSR